MGDNHPAAVDAVTGIQRRGAWPSKDAIEALSRATGTREADLWSAAMTRFHEMGVDACLRAPATQLLASVQLKAGDTVCKAPFGSKPV